MFHPIKAVFIGLSLLSTCPLFSAQAKVYVTATTPDLVGSRLVFAIKEGIRRSSSMELVDRAKDASMHINIVTIDPDRGSGNRTIYSVVWTTQTFHNPPVTMYLTQSVGFCGSNRVIESADSLIADTDEQVTKVRGWIREILESNTK